MQSLNKLHAPAQIHFSNFNILKDEFQIRSWSRSTCFNTSTLITWQLRPALQVCLSYSRELREILQVYTRHWTRQSLRVHTELSLSFHRLLQINHSNDQLLLKNESNRSLFIWIDKKANCSTESPSNPPTLSPSTFHLLPSYEFYYTAEFYTIICYPTLFVYFMYICKTSKSGDHMKVRWSH